METILVSLLEEMRSLAPEVLDGLVNIQAAKYTLYAALWWKFLLLAIVCGGAAYFISQSSHAESLEGLAMACTLLGVLALLGFVTMILLLLDRPLFNASPEVYVLRSLLRN